MSNKPEHPKVLKRNKILALIASLVWFASAVFNIVFYFMENGQFQLPLAALQALVGAIFLAQYFRWKAAEKTSLKNAVD